MPKHTPGPWVSTEEPDHEGSFFAIRNNRGYLIATTGTHDLGEQKEANARLIATAPALLDAIAELLKISTTDEWSGSGRLDDALNDAREALAAATGEEPR